MLIFAVTIGAIAVLSLPPAAADESKLPLNLYDLGEPDGLGSSQPTGAKQVPFTLFPQSDSFHNNKDYNYPFDNNYRPYPNRRCPLCDGSVYPYCGEKLLHDACCCTNPYIHDLPYQCKLADCRFLHANNCREHRLIANCCCSDDYRSLLKSFSKV